MEAPAEKSTQLVVQGPRNPRATEQPLFFYERRERIARNRRTPTTKRERFLLEIAIAVCDELELRQGADELLFKPEMSAAQTLWRDRARAAEQAAYNAEHPIEAAFDQVNREPSLGWSFGGGKPKKVLAWAIEQGIMPADAVALPETQTQYYLLDKHQTTLGQTSDKPQVQMGGRVQAWE